jgi:hypothetical protein
MNDEQVEKLFQKLEAELSFDEDEKGKFPCEVESDFKQILWDFQEQEGVLIHKRVFNCFDDLYWENNEKTPGIKELISRISYVLKDKKEDEERREANRIFDKIEKRVENIRQEISFLSPQVKKRVIDLIQLVLSEVESEED